MGIVLLVPPLSDTFRGVRPRRVLQVLFGAWADALGVVLVVPLLCFHIFGDVASDIASLIALDVCDGGWVSYFSCRQYMSAVGETRL